MSSAAAGIDRPRSRRWERNVPVYGFPVVNGFFLGLSGLVLIAFVLTAYRELAGLGPVSGMNDAYGWGIWKTFNVMVLTALGSGAFAVGIAAWVFRRKRLHSLMRMALLTSFLAYACGLLLLGIDAGRPWNFYWIVFPWEWNMHSPLAEVAICMSIYAMIPLAVENIPPVLERLWYFDSRLRPGVERIEKRLHYFFPWIIAAAYLLPGMHQSSLGALMLLAGERVHPLWQTPWLPVLYLGAATFMSFGCVAGTTMLCCLVWKRAMDMEVLDEAARITSWLIFGWLALRLLDILFRGALGTALHVDRFAGVFWLEMLLVAGGGLLLVRSLKTHDPQPMFVGYILSSAGGMIYRFSPTTLAFRPNPEALYFPATIEILVSLGFISLGVLGFLIAVKRLAILPAPLAEWHDMASYFRFRRPYIRWTGYFKYGHFGEDETETASSEAASSD
ncbi:MAG TPA: Ni/Fe-hydrogenase cytochrome b subunit [Candidatus Sulfotelmatobacter sp.]|nr:Ni/Fe-hydrogenase cytochrome b subunit [Candidatus Sulfotelmatobacter sp.]